MEVVREQMSNELSGPGCPGEYRSMWHMLRLKNIQVPRHVVAELMREMDPEGCEQRRAKSLKRRSYFSSGPNYTWHADGVQKSPQKVANSYKVKQPSRNYCQFLFELCGRAKRLSNETED